MKTSTNAARNLIAVSFLLAALAVGCGEDSGAEAAVEPVEPAATATLGQLSAAERLWFCEWRAETMEPWADACGLLGAGEEDRQTQRAQACLEHWDAQMDCSVAAYQACEAAREEGACDVVPLDGPEACAALADCPVQPGADPPPNAWISSSQCNICKQNCEMNESYYRCIDDCEDFAYCN